MMFNFFELLLLFLGRVHTLSDIESVRIRMRNMIKKLSMKKMFLQGFYDPRINQGVWLTLAMGMLYLLFVLLGMERFAVISILAVFPAIIAGADKPGPRFSVHLARLILLLSGVAALVIYLGRYGVPLAAIFFPLIFVCSMFYVLGSESGRVGTSVMFVAIIALSWPVHQPAWYFPLLLTVGLIWYGICARLWMLYWGHQVLRNILTQLFLAMGDYYTLKTDILLENADEESRDIFYKKQEVVYTLINQGKSYLRRYDENQYDRELTMLGRDFFFAVDVMELLQSSQHNLTKMREFISNSKLEGVFFQASLAVVGSLKKKSFGIHVRRETDLAVDDPLLGLEKALAETALTDLPFVQSMLLHLQALRQLLSDQRPVFDRKIMTANTEGGVLVKLKPHLNLSSPSVRYALRLATTICAGLFVVDFLSSIKVIGFF